MPSSTSKGFLDKAPLDFACQHEGCKRKIKTTIGALRRNPTLRCSAGHATKVNAKDLDKEIRKVEQSTDKLFKRH
jgi:hypothetical protein